MFETLVNPDCSHCVDEARRKAGVLRDDDRVLAWIRGKYDGGAIPYRWFLVPYRVISDTYGVFVYDADADFVRGWPASLDYRFHGWRNGVMVMRHKDGTLFDCLTGVAFDGPRKGEQLTPLPTIESDWGPWLKANPGTVAYAMVSKFQPQSAPEVCPPRVAKDSSRAGPASRRGGAGLRPGPRRGEPGLAAPVLRRAAGAAEGKRRRQERPSSSGTAGRGPRRPTHRRRRAKRANRSRSRSTRATPIAPGWTRRRVRVGRSLGRAVSGPRKGQTLRWLPGVMVKWYAWAAEYPKTSIEKAEGDSK